MKKVTNFLIPFLLLMFFSSLLSAQTTWNGNNSSDWTDAGNWSAGVPDLVDDVNIPNVANDPVIMNGVTGLAKSVEVQAGATFDINNGGILNIDGSTGNGLTNLGTTNNSGILTVASVTINGIQNLGVGATFNNNGGTIEIDNCAASGIVNQSGASFTNSNGGVIDIGQNDGNIGQHGISCSPANSEFKNDGGTIKIDDIGFNNTDADGIVITGGGLFQNLNGGQVLIGQLNRNMPSEGIALVFGGSKLINDNGIIKIDNTGRYGIQLIYSTAIENKNGGQVLIGQAGAGSIGSHGIISSNGTTISNDGGRIEIDHCAASGIVNQSGASFTNSNGGLIDIGQNGGDIGNHGIRVGGNGSIFNNDGSIVNVSATGIDGVELSASSTFNNTNGGELNIRQTAGDGIALFSSTFINDMSTINIDDTSNGDGIRFDHSTFENKNNSQLLIGQAGNISRVGIWVAYSSGFFNDGSTLKIDRSNIDGIHVFESSMFENLNNGNVNIGQLGSIVNHGIIVFNGCYFKNDGSFISIDNPTGNGIWNIDGGQFSNLNDGQILVGQNGSIGDHGMLNNGSFDNLSCSTVHLFDDLDNTTGTILNAGLFSIDTADPSAEGNFTNNGVIEIVQLPLIPNVINNDLIIAPIIGGCTITDALQIGGANSFAVSDEWFLDAGLSNKAGDYDQPTNIFDATNLNVGAHTLFFTVDGNGCQYEVSVPLTIDEDLAVYTGNVQFTTQAQLDAWSSCYRTINGHVIISGANITDLSPLENIVSITGNLTIQYTGLTDLTGLGSLATVGGTVVILFNSSLTALTGLGSLATVGGNFWMYYNFQLSDCCAIDDLLTAGGVSGPVLIFFNAAGSHCNSAAAIMAACPVAPLVGSGSSNSFVQACSDCIPQGLMTVFPNPTSTTVNVKWSGENPSGTVQLTDLLGRVLMEHKLQSRNEFNVSRLGSGIYLVRVKVDGYKQQVERVVVER